MKISAKKIIRTPPRLQHLSAPEKPAVLKTASPGATPSTEERISVVIPVRNEAENLPQFLHSLEHLPVAELILVDGGSSDDSLFLLQSWAAHSNADSKNAYRRILRKTRPGRARQMNAGAKQATGDILLFLHADTRLPAEGIDLILETMKNKTLLGGAFRLHIASKHPFLLWVCWIANLRSVYWKLPYGDQAFFVRRTVFEAIGGYPDLPLMEDVALIRRLKKEGRIVLLKKTVSTSARRWRRQGYYFTSFRNMLLLGLYFAGVSPKRLAKWYD